MTDSDCASSNAHLNDASTFSSDMANEKPAGKPGGAPVVMAEGPAAGMPPAGMVGGPPAGMPPAGGPAAGMPPAGGPPAGMAGGPPAGMPPMGMAGGPPAGMPPVGGPPAGIPFFGSGQDGQEPAEDPVSGALNLPGFGREYAMATMSGNFENLALWYVDIRNFRSVNPKYGFPVGNMVLHSLCDGVKEHVSLSLPIARLGGDRFILLSAQFDYEEAETRFAKLIEYINEAAATFGITNPIELTGGIYFLREPDFKVQDFKRALDYASIAHRKARIGINSALELFTDEDLERDTRRITIEQSIDQALAEGQIEVWYQPQIDYTLGEVVGAEALARWKHPELGWISPAEFIPVLENCGKVHDLDLFVWEEACRSAGKWRNAADGNPVPISVNVSRAEMFEAGLKEHFLELQRKYDLPEGSLHLEITESAFVEEADRLYRVIDDMRKNNMMVEMDDFGSGLSSLNMLKDVKVDVVKLDMGFMRTAVNEDRGGVVLGSVIRMLQGLDTPIIAEGVETLEQAEMLKNLGCHLMQGFHFSRPMPLDEFEGYIASNSSEERTRKRERNISHLEDLMGIDTASSYLFNNAIGGMMYFLTNGNSSESILVNDEFYVQCGLDRLQFGNAKVNPIMEIDEESRSTLWRAAAEARDKGSAMCRAQVRLTKRWIECVMRYIGPSARGEIYSLNICRSGDIEDVHSDLDVQFLHDMGWSFQLLGSIIPNGFVKCFIDDDLSFDFVSPSVIAHTGMTEEAFMRRFHGSFANFVVPANRLELMNAVRESVRTGGLIERDFTVFGGFGTQSKASFIGRVAKDALDEQWLYAIVLFKESEVDEGTGNGGNGEGARDASSQHEISFDYFMEEDKLVIYDNAQGQHSIAFTRSNWLATMESLSQHISKASAAKVLAAVRDLRHHPISGFMDLKCNLRGGDALRWYHINYTCEGDGQGNTVVVHGFAHDADDQMGSAKWWRRQAEIDQLTGLLNRNAVEQRINLAMRTQGSGMMLMIDLDGFKRVNDDLGHLTGDALLRDVAKALEHHFREGDVLGRYGGDEFVAFVAVAPDDAHQVAKRRATDILKAISDIEIPDGTHAGCSVGVSVSTDRNTTFYDLLEVADKAMYESKTAGKGVFTVIEMGQVEANE